MRRRVLSSVPYQPFAITILSGLILSACATTNNTARRAAIAALTGIDIDRKASSEEDLNPNDPNVTCKPKYTQVYQPPLKLGGAGRVIQVPSGQTCKPIEGKEVKTDASVFMRQANFTSLPSGAIIVIHKQDKDFTALSGCTTPCSMELDARGRYIGCPSSYKVARISARAKRDFAHLFG